MVVAVMVIIVVTRRRNACSSRYYNGGYHGGKMLDMLRWRDMGREKGGGRKSRRSERNQWERRWRGASGSLVYFVVGPVSEAKSELELDLDGSKRLRYLT
jgi:hypothetical protein